MDAEITRATASDSAVIAQLLVDSWRFAYKGIMPDEHLAALSVEQRSKAWTKHLIAGGEAYLLKDDDGVAGIVEISRFRDVLAGFEHYGEIPVIYLKPEKIGVGYGRRLMKFAVAVLAARNQHNVGIWVLEKNARAIEFYRKHDFEFSGNTKVHSATGLVEWLMVRGPQVNQQIPQLCTERLLLRPLAPEDESAMVALLMNPEFMAFSPSGALNEASAKTRFCALMLSFARQGFSKFAILLRSSNELIGYCGVELCEIEGAEKVELGFRLALQRRGIGYATEAANAFLAWYDSHFKAKVIAFTEPGNEASVRVLQKLGFGKTGEAVVAEMPVIVFGRQDQRSAKAT